ncbi:hypothetical protein B0H67DRAFT_639057 [Lasiosphaeris hirsuta]|uniref:Ribosomal protein L9 domain-containing protein n=1 Tax=Lasiosphaeris hirsuta TaxID=260670 RepID=A0AA40BAE7_9PEZI|nr:hypothetical protein B0H67DRAFT_639057 [Lasiosphaeris hirsuta]
MAGPVLSTSTSPTCLACLRRLVQPFAKSSIGAVASIVQVRAKSRAVRSHDQGVVVRLLEDIPKFGRRDAVFRVERGRMRNEWFPSKKAEYMTAARFQELGLTRNDIGDRDRGFATFMPEVPVFKILEPVQPTPVAPAAPVVSVVQTNPETIRDLLTTLLPETLTFFRKPIPAPPPPPPPALTPPPKPSARISPLVASARTSKVEDAKSTVTKTPESPERNTLAIFGSVSVTDVVNHVKKLLMADLEASRISLGPENIRFVGLLDNSDRVKALGRWEVEISVDGSGSVDKNGSLKPVRKMVEILPTEQASI